MISSMFLIDETEKTSSYFCLFGFDGQQKPLNVLGRKLTGI